MSCVGGRRLLACVRIGHLSITHWRWKSSRKRPVHLWPVNRICGYCMCLLQSLQNHWWPLHEIFSVSSCDLSMTLLDFFSCEFYMTGIDWLLMWTLHDRDWVSPSVTYITYTLYLVLWPIHDKDWCLHDRDWVSTWQRLSVYMTETECLHDRDRVSTWQRLSVYMTET